MPPRPRQLAQDGATAGQAMSWNGTIWAPASAAGDVSGGLNALSVDKVKGYAVDLSTPPVTGQVLAWNGTAFVATNPPSSILIWGQNAINATGPETRYLSPGYDNQTAPVTPEHVIRAPRPGTMHEMFVHHGATGGNALSVVYTLMKYVAGVWTATALTVSLATLASDASDTTHDVAIAAGDLLTVSAYKPGAMGISILDILITMEFSL